MWETILNWGFDIIQFFYNFVHDWGMSIIIVTLIFRLILSPLVHRQTKSTYAMQKIQPQMQDLQRKYAGDQQRLNQEMQKLYAEAHFNPLTGCLPMILQMPLFFVYFRVLRTMGDRVEGSSYEFYGLVPDLTMSPSSAWDISFTAFIPYGILILIFAGATFTPMIVQQIRNSNQQAQQARMTIIMGVIMTLVMLWIGWGSPAGVLLYWGVSSLFGIGQTQITLYIWRRRDRYREEHEVIIKPVEVDVTRKEKKARPTKGSGKKKKK